MYAAIARNSRVQSAETPKKAMNTAKNAKV
jgi:hypothetical protein